MRRVSWMVGLHLALMLPFAPARATETAEVTRAEGLVWRTVTADPSPIPICSIWWRHDPAEGTQYHAVPADDFPYELCASTLVAHCGGDSLAFTGWWLERDVSGIAFFRDVSLGVTLGVDLLVTAPTRITATRRWLGDLANEVHQVTLTDPDGTLIPLLAADDPEDTAQQVLAPGAYGVEIYLDVDTLWQEYGAYDGAVTVTWEDASTPVSQASWGAVKSLYR